MENKLTIRELAPYLPYGVVGLYNLKNVSDHYPDEERQKVIDPDNAGFFLAYCKPYLRPLSDLTSEIEHNGARFVPIEYFEIGDDDNYAFEFDSGNIKLINKLSSIASHNVYHDIQFLPHAVVQKLTEWHFDHQGLIDRGLALPINK